MSRSRSPLCRLALVLLIILLTIAAASPALGRQDGETRLGAMTGPPGGSAQAASTRVPATPPSMAAEPAIIQGTVTDAGGHPIAGATIVITEWDWKTVCEIPIQTGDVTYIVRNPCDRAFNTVTDRDGRYRLAVSRDATLAYTVEAYHEVVLGDEPYAFPLHPADGDRSDESAVEGIVEDFTWRISGRLPTIDGTHDPDQEQMYPHDYYGGSIDVIDAFEDDRPLAERYPDGSYIEVMLEPRGPMIDGSAGETQRVRVDLGGNSMDDPDAEDGYVLDVPVGPYHASANLVLPGGEVVPLLVSVGCSYPDSLEGFAASDELDFAVEPIYVPMGFGGIDTVSLCVTDG